MTNRLRNDRAGGSLNVPVPRSSVGPPSTGCPGVADDAEQRRGDERPEASGNRIRALPDHGSLDCHIAVYVHCGGDRQSWKRRIDALLAYPGSHLPVLATVATIIDDSRAILPRSGLPRLLQEISAGKIDMVLVEYLTAARTARSFTRVGVADASR